MAEINLKKYLAKLDALQKQGLHTEVIQHARHILQKYPKNAAAHRLLAQASLAAGQLNEAEQEYRRVLGAYPDEAESYIGLSRIARQRRKFDEAIGYAELAADLSPNDPELVKYLRDLYSEHRGIKNAKIPQGAYSVALQQRRAEMYSRAADTLRAAVSQQPGRADLQVLLADVLWEGGDEVGAAEVAIEILKRLPNAVRPNRILTQLWLDEQRPSDAQRYLSAIESIDPYAAFAIIETGTPPETAYTIEELDYEREAKRQLSTLEPDWLGGLSEEDLDREESPAVEAALADVDTVDTTEDNTSLEEMLSDTSSSDWMQEIESVKLEADSPTRVVRPPSSFDDADLLSLFEESKDKEKTPHKSPKRSTGLTGLLTSLEESEEGLPTTSNTGLTGLLGGESGMAGSGTGLTGLLNALDDGEEAENGLERTEADAQSFYSAFAQDELTGEAEDFTPETALDTDAGDMFDMPDFEALLGDQGEEAHALELPEEDPMAWMKHSGIEVLDEAEPSAFDEMLANEFDDGGVTFSDPNENNPLAWMQDHGIEVIEENPPSTSPFEMPSTPVDDNFLADLGEQADDEQAADPLAWMRDEGIELIEDDDIEDSLDWMKDTDNLPDYTEAVGDAELFAGVGAAEGDAMNDKNDSGLPDWGNLFDDEDSGQEEDLFAASSDEPFSLEFSDEAMEPDEAGSADWLGTVSAGQTMLDSTESADDDWMSSLETPEGEEEPAAADVPDWLASGDFGGEEVEEEGEEEAPVQQMPDWLASSAPVNLFGNEETEDEFYTDEEEAVSDSEALGWLAPQGETPTDLFGGEAEEESDELIPDWLSGAPLSDASTSDEEEAEEEFAGAEETPSWLASGNFGGELLGEEEAEEEFAGAEETPSWLAGGDFGGELLGEEEAEEEFAGAEETPSWLAGGDFGSEALDEEEAEEEFAVAEETPSWLAGGDFGSELLGEEEAEEEFAVAEETPSWLAGGDFGSEALGEEIEEEELVGDTTPPDWLSTTEFAAAQADEIGELGEEEPLPFDDAEHAPEWLAFGAETEQPEEEAAISGQPDWLAASAPTFAQAGDSEEDEAVLGAFGQLDFDALDGELEPLAEEELEPLAFDAETAMNELDEIEEAELGFDEEEAEFLPIGDENGSPEWLSTLQEEEEALVAQSDEEAALEEALSDYAEFEADFGTEEEAEAQPDWLNGMGLGQSSGEEAEEEPYAPAQMPEWLGSTDTGPLPAMPADETPEWLGAIGRPSEADSFDYDEVEAEENVPQWLADVGDTNEPYDENYDEDELMESQDVEAVVEDIPDWLAGASPLSSVMDSDDGSEDQFADIYDIDEDADLEFAEAGRVTEELLPTPAENAPDWLNAMVPGLDVDYTVQDEDAPMESQFVGAEEARSTADYAWVNDIVSQELAPPQTIPVGLSTREVEAIPAEERKPRFSFSKAPRWMRKLRGEDVGPAARAKQQDDDDDVDALPDWLDFDDDAK